MSIMAQQNPTSISTSFKLVKPIAQKSTKTDIIQSSKEQFLLNPARQEDQLTRASQNRITQVPQLMQIYPSYYKDVDYSKEFCKLAINNEQVISQIMEIMNDKDELRQRINYIEDFIEKKTSQSIERLKKKNRRTAQEIEKAFICPYENCQKGYGSDVSLNLHIKLKHNGGSKTQRETVARAIFLSKLNNELPPQVDISFPPGYLDNFQKNYEEPNWRSTNSSNSKQKDDESTQSETLHSPKLTLKKK